MEPVAEVIYSRRRKILISAFILFHFACVIAWLLPSSWPLKAPFFILKMPLPLSGILSVHEQLARGGGIPVGVEKLE